MRAIKDLNPSLGSACVQAPTSVSVAVSLIRFAGELNKPGHNSLHGRMCPHDKAHHILSELYLAHHQYAITVQAHYFANQSSKWSKRLFLSPPVIIMMLAPDQGHRYSSARFRCWLPGISHLPVSFINPASLYRQNNIGIGFILPPSWPGPSLY